MHTHPEPAYLPCKPPLRWAGGKTRLLPQLLPLLPTGRRLIEPFLGAGSVFLATNYETYLLGDANPDLAAMWIALKQRPKAFCESAAAFYVPENHSKDAYLRLRDVFNSSEDSFERATLMPYLNAFGFNGLYRVNRQGKFNVPYGDPKQLPPFHWDRYSAAADKLQNATVLNGGFAGTLEHAGHGDIVYCDPPYLDTGTGTVSFVGYTEGKFGLEEHQHLLECCRQAASRGATVLISNHDSPQVRELYAGLRLESLTVHRSVSASTQSRGVARELVAILQGIQK